jgi:hypothetical protein
MSHEDFHILKYTVLSMMKWREAGRIGKWLRVGPTLVKSISIFCQNMHIPP